MTFGGDHSAGFYEKPGPEAVRPVIPPELEALFAQQGCLRACGPEVNDWANTLVGQENVTIVTLPIY